MTFFPVNFRLLLSDVLKMILPALKPRDFIVLITENMIFGTLFSRQIILPALKFLITENMTIDDQSNSSFSHNNCSSRGGH
jgi:hypothetical protein